MKQKSPDFRSPEFGISVIDHFNNCVLSCLAFEMKVTLVLTLF